MSTRPRITRDASRAAGFTLVELMVAMTLGLLVTAAVLTLYLAASRNYTQDERFALLQENGRYALKVLGEDLAMADFWGQVISTDIITAAVTVPGGNCAEPVAAFDADSGLLFNNYHASPATTHFSPCAAVTGNRFASTDVLVVKRVHGAPTARTFVDSLDSDGDGDSSEIITTGASDLEPNEVYLRTNGTVGTFVDDATAVNPPALGESDWRYVPRLYFVRDFFQTPGDGIPTLCRFDLVQDGFGAAQCLAEGVEDFHLQWGLDANGDGVANRYTSTPSPADMNNVVAVRIYLLLRSARADPHYTNSKAYRLGDVNIGAANDGFYRRVYTSTVVVRNAVGRRQFL